MKTDKQKLGTLGESRAWRYLRKRGYVLLAKNYSCVAGEIDLIALETKRSRRLRKDFFSMPKVFRDENVIVFVEVKTRTRDDFGKPSEAVDLSKQRRYHVVSQHFFSSTGIRDVQFRFDIIEVCGVSVNHIPNAF